jgi:hypothetical protein
MRYPKRLAAQQIGAELCTGDRADEEVKAVEDLLA